MVKEIREYINYIVGSDQVLLPQEIRIHTPSGYLLRKENFLSDNLLIPIVFYPMPFLHPLIGEKLTVYAKIPDIIKWSKR